MATLSNKGRNGGKLMRPAKGETMNPNGRPRKWVSTLIKDRGYKLSEVHDAMKVLMEMSEKELIEVEKDQKATIMERTVAAALLKSKRNSSLYSMETILDRTFGKPKETTELTGPEGKPLFEKITIEIVK